MRKVLWTALIIASCAAPAEITVQAPAALVDSYPGNGSVLPADQVSPLLFVFTSELDEGGDFLRHLTLSAIDQESLVPIISCSQPQPQLLECPLGVAPQPETRYELKISPDLPFASGQTLGVAYSRWFETLANGN